MTELRHQVIEHKGEVNKMEANCPYCNGTGKCGQETIEWVKLFHTRRIALIGLSKVILEDGEMGLECSNTCVGWTIALNACGSEYPFDIQRKIELLLGDGENGEFHPFATKDTGGCEVTVVVKKELFSD